MKKIVLFLLIGASLFSSCSSEESSSEPSQTANGEKIIEVVIRNANGSILITQEYEYEGNKLSRVVFSDDSFNKIFYTGDFITKMEAYRNDILTSTMYVEYNDDGKLSNTVMHAGSNGYKTTYIYNTDNTVTVTEYTGDLNNQNTVVKNHKAFLVNDIMVKRETYGTDGVVYTREYTYDSKNNPTNRILGYGRLTQYEVGSTVSPYNVTQIIYKQSDITGPVGISTSTFTYNSYNCPMTSSNFENGVLSLTMEYRYAVQ